MLNARVCRIDVTRELAPVATIASRYECSSNDDYRRHAAAMGAVIFLGIRVVTREAFVLNDDVEALCPIVVFVGDICPSFPQP